jgi:hypothetical protein
MAIPSVQNMGAQPGGGLVSSLNALNDLMQNNIKTEYAPYTAYSDAASKLAYARLMGPQFLAKLMGNPDVVANNPQLQDPKTGAALYQAGMGAGAIGGGPSAAGNALNNMPVPGQSSQSNPLARAGHALANILGFGDSSTKTTSSNALLQNQPNLSQQDKNAVGQMQPGDSYVLKGAGADSGYSYDKNGANIKATPEEVSNVAGTPVNTNQSPDTYAEHAGRFKGIIGEGEEAGKIRAQDMKDLGEEYKSSLNKQTTLDDLSRVLTSPEMMQIRNLPVAQQQELGWYSKFGSPAQQKTVGNFLTDSGDIVKESASDFRGQFRVGEQKLLNTMKVNPNDSIDVATGKMQSLMYFNKMVQDRSRTAAQLMEKEHLNKTDALEKANKMLNTDKIKDQIKDQLTPKITIYNPKTGERMTLPLEEARRRGVKNV